MGFARGSDIAIAVARKVKHHVSDILARRAIYGALVSALEDADWDTQCEAEGIDPIPDKLLGRDES